MWNWLDSVFQDNQRGWLFLGFLYIVYLCYALILHRKDRKELETKMMEKERIEEIEFHYSWKGVKVRMRCTPYQKPGRHPCPWSISGSFLSFYLFRACILEVV
ncbi:hypothetical protein V8G54_000066 (mitochondrion) [Vigna mungo]|uniref:Transmembrane protein n=1 Tax=Vigna mungo TaxID=3915 RepID=A0AAQ3PK67_VIGMU